MGGLSKIGDIIFIDLSDLDSNVFLIGDTIIDSGTGFNFTRMYQALKILKLAHGDIKSIVNTHAHFDHIGGNGYFADASIAVHESDAEIIIKGDVSKSYADFYDGKLNPREVKTKLKEGDKVSAGSYEFEVIHTPGHTPGSICLYDKKQKVLISGDTIFSDGVGRTDLPGGDEKELEASLEKIADLEVLKLLPGHGKPLILDKPKKVSEILSGPVVEESESV